MPANPPPVQRHLKGGEVRSAVLAALQSKEGLKICRVNLETFLQLCPRVIQDTILDQVQSKDSFHKLQRLLRVVEMDLELLSRSCLTEEEELRPLQGFLLEVRVIVTEIRVIEVETWIMHVEVETIETIVEPLLDPVETVIGAGTAIETVIETAIATVMITLAIVTTETETIAARIVQVGTGTASTSNATIMVEEMLLTRIKPQDLIMEAAMVEDQDLQEDQEGLISGLHNRFWPRSMPAKHLRDATARKLVLEDLRDLLPPQQNLDLRFHKLHRAQIPCLRRYQCLQEPHNRHRHRLH